MRSIITVSLPKNVAGTLKKRAKTFGFASLSEYFRYLVSLDDGLITQDELLAASREAEREYKAGRLERRASLADLA